MGGSRALLLLALSLAAALPVARCGGKRVLALIGDGGVRASHSRFFQGLRDAGLELDIKAVDDDGLLLRNFGSWHYDHLLLFAPHATGFGGDVTRTAILDFVDAGGNLLLALAPGASAAMRGLAADVGAEPLEPRGAAVFDHFSRQAAGGAADPALIATSAWADSVAVFGGAPPAAPVLFRGVAAAVPAGSELVMVALSASPTAYSSDPKRPEPSLPAGGGAALVSLLQARNNARALVAGSLDMFSDELFAAPVTVAATGESFPESGNRAFTLAAALWAFQRRAVLRASPPRHRVVTAGRGEEGPPLYRVKDEVEFEVDIFEGRGDGEVPYKADDVQLSFTMLDPHVRQPLVALGNGTFRLAFTVPDVYGVFKYEIDYRRPGYSYIRLRQVIPVQPFKHDEYERFLLPAYPYYASTLSTMAAFFLAGWVFLYGK
ncbi:MAG: dolichyl-diphosphooligosaccharide-protein glycosyltransferase [Monoraphidium minutum]|nr:MAG: dolichyl-diphosphooligosaccharide-protein glycosyltransferase [Monoraphidium minutum]